MVDADEQARHAFRSLGRRFEEALQAIQDPPPPRGYWAKKRVGITVSRAPLQNESDPKLQTVVSTYDPDPKPCENPPEPWYPVKAPDLIALVERERDPKFRITVPATLHNPHPVVARTREWLAGGKAPEQGEGLMLDVAKSSIPRALRLMNALFRALEERGWPVEVRPRRASRIYERNRVRCSILGSEYGFRLREKTRITEPSKSQTARTGDNRPAYEHTGIFELGISDPHGFDDRIVRDWKKVPLEERLNEVIIELLIKVEKDRGFRARQEERHAAENARREQQRLEQLERDRASKFEAMTERWVTAMHLRMFLDAAKAEASRRRVTPETEPAVARWLEWAEQHVRTLDPLSSDRPLPVYSSWLSEDHELE